MADLRGLGAATPVTGGFKVPVEVDIAGGVPIHADVIVRDRATADAIAAARKREGRGIGQGAAAGSGAGSTP